MTWGEQLTEARRARGFTQEELAERLGVSRQAVAKWERDAARPGPANARALRDLLGEDFPAPPAPSPASPTPEPASPAPAADAPAAPPAKPKLPRRWLAAAGGLGLLFCLLTHFNYLLAAGLGVWLLGLTAAGVVFGAVSRTARGQGVQPVLALGVRAATRCKPSCSSCAAGGILRSRSASPGSKSRSALSPSRRTARPKPPGRPSSPGFGRPCGLDRPASSGACQHLF